MIQSLARQKSSYIFATIFALRSKTASNISHPRPQPRPVRYDPPLPLMIFHWAALRIPLNALLGRRPRIVNIKKAIEKVFNCVVYLKAFFPIVCMAFNWIVYPSCVKSYSNK